MLRKLVKGLPSELRLILAGATGDIDKIKHLLQQAIDWDKFLRLAEHHRVCPSVYMTLRQLGYPLVAEHVLDILKQKYQENTLNALRITGETVRIASILGKHRISIVVLKGAPLSWHLYGDIAARTYGDIDILVGPDKLEQSIAILGKEGYCRISKYDSYDLTPRQLLIYLRHHEHNSHFEYWNSEKRVMLEIHWKLSKYNNVLPFPADGNINTISVAGNHVPVLSDEESLLYLVLHGAGHKWHRLCWLVDINKFIQQEHIDWASLERRAEKYGMRVFLHHTLILVSQLFEVDLPPGLERSVARDKSARRMTALALQSCILDNGNRAWSSGLFSFFANIFYYLFMSRGLKSKFNYIFKLIRPSVEDIRMVALPDRLYAMYYIIGPFAFIARRLRRLIVGK